MTKKSEVKTLKLYLMHVLVPGWKRKSARFIKASIALCLLDLKGMEYTLEYPMLVLTFYSKYVHAEP